MNEPGFRQGDQIAGKYTLERILASGGMGVVAVAVHDMLGEKVAIKFLLPEFAGDPGVRARFVREAQACVRIKSEHVARVMDVGVLDTGEVYLVMELLDGRDLADELRERRRIPVQEAVGILLEACEAIAEAHALGIVHRDIKPSNLFLTRRADGTRLVKVLDFGIAKAPAKGAEGVVTATQAVLGSPIYMSPEQVRSSKDVDARTDVWSLGILLHELVAGQPPFPAETVSGLLASIIADPPTPLGTAAPGAPPGLEAIVSRCLEKDRTRRFADLGELARALEPFGTHQAHTSVERIVGTVGSREGAATVAATPAALDAAVTAPTIALMDPHASAPPAEGSPSAPFDRAAPLVQTSSAWGAQQPPQRATRRWLALGVLVVGAAAAALAVLSAFRGPATGSPAAPSEPRVVEAAPTVQAQPTASASPEERADEQPAAPEAPSPPEVTASTAEPSAAPTTIRPPPARPARNPPPAKPAPPRARSTDVEERL